jgi:DNA-binding transcriptional ArsR family regulator
MEPDRERMYRLHAEVCKALANPQRLAIIDLLRSGEVSVGEIAEVLGRSISNTSQHLAVLKSSGLVRCRKEGTTCYYSVSTRKVFKAFECLGEILYEGTAERAEHREYLETQVLP